MTKTLQQKYTGLLFSRLLLVMLTGCLLFYFLMRMQAIHMQQKQLDISQSNIWNAFSKEPGSLPAGIPGEYDITQVPLRAGGLAEQPRDTSFADSRLSGERSFKKLSRYHELGAKKYLLTTYVSDEEINHLILKVFITEALLLLALFMAILYINRRTAGRLWQPFHHTMDKLNSYDIQTHKAFELPAQTGVREFDELNGAVVSLLHKVNQAYINQRQFVENASHEIQTPLAIIRSKLELLINQPLLNAEMAGPLADISDANERLSQLNKNLLLLAKIENRQFPSTTPVNMSVLLQQALNTYRLHAEDRFPSLETSIAPEVILHAHQPLLEVLVHNLVRNAVMHNIPCGYIRVSLDSGCLLLTNSGEAPVGEPVELFERFRKGREDVKSTGLGLAIVKQICQLYDYRVEYVYANQAHTITVYF